MTGRTSQPIPTGWEAPKPPAWDDRSTLRVRGPVDRWHQRHEDRAVVTYWWTHHTPVFHSVRWMRDDAWLGDQLATRCGVPLPSRITEVPLWVLRGRARPCKRCFDLASVVSP